MVDEISLLDNYNEVSEAILKWPDKEIKNLLFLLWRTQNLPDAAWVLDNLVPLSALKEWALNYIKEKF